MRKARSVTRTYANHGVSAARSVIKPGTRAARVQTYLREAADAFGLKDWDVIFEPAELPKDKDADAEAEVMEAQHVRIRLAEGFWDYPPTYQRLVLAHELCHCHTARLVDVVDALAGALSKQAYKFAEGAFESVEEHIVESFARLLADRLPLPKF